jgi:heme exporter protein A
MPFETVTSRDLTKIYGSTRALAGVSLTFRSGMVTTLEGPNGAGKSTLLALLSTLARPTSGSLAYGEYNPREDLDVIRPAIGLVAHEALVYPDLSPRESLSLLADLYELPQRETAVKRAIERTGLGEIAHRPARTFSRGQLQRLALARAQLHDPKLLLFDEPTTGLDRVSTERVAAAIESARKEGKIVVLVTHDHGLAERVGDLRVFLEHGKVKQLVQRG